MHLEPTVLHISVYTGIASSSDEKRKSRMKNDLFFEKNRFFTVGSFDDYPYPADSEDKEKEKKLFTILIMVMPLPPS